jgi:uncharacterized membrane protein
MLAKRAEVRSTRTDGFLPDGVGTEMQASLRAALAYFALAFAAGFALGALRLSAIVPRIGETRAVLFELPVMLAISWVACRSIIRRYSVPVTWPSRLVMGGVAFTLLLIAELGVSLFGLQHTIAEHLSTYRSPGAAIGLLGQITYAFFPLIQLRRQSREHQ